MKKRMLIALVVVLALTGTASVVWAKGGSNKGGDVCWVARVPPTEVRAIFYKTGSGIIHEWRYSPEHVHIVFKPVDSFPEPDEGSWGTWRYWGQYGECDPPSEYSLSDFLELDTQYWLQYTWQ